MRRTLISGAIGIGLAFAIMSGVDLYSDLRRAADLAELQTLPPEAWFGVSEVEVLDAIGVGQEPIAQWVYEPKRHLEVQLSVSNRNVHTGDTLCSGGSLRVIVDPQSARQLRAPMSRVAGVDECLWPAGAYRTRLTWTLIDPETRITKSIFVESDEFEVSR